MNITVLLIHKKPMMHINSVTDDRNKYKKNAN